MITQENCFYSTLLSSEDYLLAVLVLNESLKKVNSYFQLMVGITEDLPITLDEILQHAGCKTQRIPRLEYNEDTKQASIRKNHNPSVLNTASKLSLFTLDVDKMVYLDADTIVLQNIDELFNWPDGAMIRGNISTPDQTNMGYTGLMVICPKQHNWHFYKTVMDNSECYDGNLFGELWFAAKTNPTYQIPDTYITNIDSIQNVTIDPWKWEDIKIVHYCGSKKPWLLEINEYAKNIHWYTHFYYQLLEQVKKKYL